MSTAEETVSAEQPAVLIVDDVDANLVALRALLENLGCTVTSANSGNQALRSLLRQPFAVMLLDVQMPEMDGYEVARHARMIPATRDVPIIFLTATHDPEEHVLRGYGSGAVDFLFKPIDADVLRSKVRIFLELYSGRRQLADANQKLEAKNAQLRALAEMEAGVAASLRRANEELQTAYSDLQATQAQLVQSAKMASLGELVAGVAKLGVAIAANLGVRAKGVDLEPGRVGLQFAARRGETARRGEGGDPQEWKGPRSRSRRRPRPWSRLRG